jgi:hypothetical protein
MVGGVCVMGDGIAGGLTCVLHSDFSILFPLMFSVCTQVWIIWQVVSIVARKIFA